MQSTDSYDFVIVGGGVAGLRAAIALAPAGRVLVLTKAEPAESNTGYAQGGIAAAVGDDDTPALHAADTMRAGDGLCDEAAVRVLVEQGPQYVRELLDWGTRFDRDAGGRPALAREAAHSVRRVLHAGDATGREIGRVLWEHVRTLPTVETVDHALVTEVIVDAGHARGLRYFDADGTSRDVHATATLLATGGSVYLTLAHLDPEYVRARFPTIAAMCAQAGLDLARDRIPVGPAAHYMMGGVDTDEWARTSVPGLFAAGEAACTGVHGANRLASNSLLEGLVFGARAAIAMQEPARAAARKPDRMMADGSWLMAHGTNGGDHRPYAISHGPFAIDRDAIRDLMWRAVGLFRDRAGLEEATARLDAAVDPPPSNAAEWRLRNLLTVARLIAGAALRREESRGGHYRADFPRRDDDRWR